MELLFLPKHVLICPFTKMELVPLSEKELEVINSKIGKGELFYHQGAQVKQRIQQAFSSANYLYIYMVHEGVLLLKQDTAIVSRSRVANPFHKNVPAEDNAFYQSYGLDRVVDQQPVKCESSFDKELRDDILGRISKKGNLLVTANAMRADDVLNLAYGVDYKHHVHLDHNFNRLQSVGQELGSDVVQVLSEQTMMPLAPASVDAYLDLEELDALTSPAQEQLYETLKSVLHPAGVLIKLSGDEEHMIFKKLLATESFHAKAKSIVMPWKKSNLPLMHFIHYKLPSGKTKEGVAVKNGELSRFFS